MFQIDVDFPVWKELTARRRSESHTYNEVIRELLDMDHISPTHAPLAIAAMSEKVLSSIAGPTTGIALRGLTLPNGTLLRATHKGREYNAQIVDGKWVNESGMTFNSPSAAANAITGTNVNGWRFWQAKRPSDSDWRYLDGFSKS